MYNGDCHTIIKQIKTESVQLIYFDPPYGVTSESWDKKLKMEELWSEFWRVLKPNGSIVVHTSIPYTIELINTQKKYFRYWWVWNKSKKTGFLNCKVQPLRNTEEICVFYKNIPKYNPQTIKRAVREDKNLDDKPEESEGYKLNKSKNSSTGYFGVFKRPNGRYRAQYEGKYIGSYTTEVQAAVAIAKTIESNSDKKETIIQESKTDKNIYKRYEKIEKKDYSEFQPCTLLSFPCSKQFMKPLELCEFIIKTYTDVDDVVLDICMHTGISGIASKRLNRKYIGIEINKVFFDNAAKNIEKSQEF